MGKNVERPIAGCCSKVNMLLLIASKVKMMFAFIKLVLHLETLQTVASFSLFANNIENRIDQLGTWKAETIGLDLIFLWMD